MIETGTSSYLLPTASEVAIIEVWKHCVKVSMDEKWVDSEFEVGATGFKLMLSAYLQMICQSIF